MSEWAPVQLAEVPKDPLDQRRKFSNSVTDVEWVYVKRSITF